MRSVADICIIGGGPAGSMLATRLAQLGHDVCLVERAAFPRRPRGESLNPGVPALLATVGADKRLESAGFVPVRSVSVRWDQGDERRVDPDPKGLLVNRGAFDRLLLDHARAAGVRVCQPGRLVGRQPRDDGWDLRIESGGRVNDLRVAFLADATGRAALLRWRRRATGCRTVALHATWQGRGLPAQPGIVAGDAEWFWGMPLPDGNYNTLVFMDAARFRVDRASLLHAGFQELISRSRLLAATSDAKMLGRVAVADATPFLDGQCVTQRSIKVGDAAISLDPISSSGVQKAIQTSLAGAIVINTLLRRPESREAAIQFYRDRLREASDRHGTWAAGHYATVAGSRQKSFWSERAKGLTQQSGRLPTREPPGPPAPDDAPLVLSPDVSFVEEPCLDADFVRLRTTIEHPSLEGTVAFLGNRELAPLLRRMRPGMTSDSLALNWSPALPLAAARDIVRWLVVRGILVPQPTEPSVRDPRRAAQC